MGLETLGHLVGFLTAAVALEKRTALIDSRLHLGHVVFLFLGPFLYVLAVELTVLYHTELVDHTFRHALKRNSNVEYNTGIQSFGLRVRYLAGFRWHKVGALRFLLHLFQLLVGNVVLLGALFDGRHKALLVASYDSAADDHRSKQHKSPGIHDSDAIVVRSYNDLMPNERSPLVI